MEARQIWTFAKPTTTSSPSRAHCTPFTLPSNGILSLAPSSILTLTTDAVFAPECTAGIDDLIITINAGTPSNYAGLRDPFYASTIPQCYALAATTVIAYMLVIMLLITPRTFLHQGAVVLGRRGFTNGPSGADAGIGIGGRPWLQKVAALTVAISLTIATADTLRVAEQQYNDGIMDALKMQETVEDGNELKIIRVISDTFLWLAQAQTLIRLFPRQREKIIIKWTAFALITLDVLFSILNNFVYEGNSRPRTFVDAVPALSYLFQLALSLLYCAWVMYYAITKNRFTIAYGCFCARVVFVLDISKPTLASWGDYVRWVGAAAASVVVWEWVERIEALERNDKRDGVLGREVFDGDEMLDITPPSDDGGSKRQKKRKDDGNGGGANTTGSHAVSWPAISGIANRYRPRATRDVETGDNRALGTTRDAGIASKSLPPLWPTRPPAAATPVSRTDTASAESTVYAIRYHPISEATPPVREAERPRGQSRSSSPEIEIAPVQNVREEDRDLPGKPQIIDHMMEGEDRSETAHHHSALQMLAKVNPFRQRIQHPPPEVSAYTVKPLQTVNGPGSAHRWDLRSKIEDFAVTQAEKLREKARPTANSALLLPVTVIPAPSRRRNLAATLEGLQEQEENDRNERSLRDPTHFDSQQSTGFSMSHEEPGSNRQAQFTRTGDPYTPTQLHRRSIQQRGAISFVTTIQDNRGHEDDQDSPPLELQRRSSPVRSQGSVFQPRSPTYRDGLPLMSIPSSTEAAEI